MVEKATTQQKGPRDPSEFGDQISKRQDVVEKASPRASGWAPENKKDNTGGHKSGGQYITVLFGL